MSGVVAGRRKGSRGQTLVEFALAFPILIFMLFALIDGARLVYAYSTLANAVREGTRFAIVNQSVSGIDAKIAANAVTLGLNSSNVDVIAYKVPEDPALGSADPSAAADCSPVAPGCIAVITAHYDFSPFTPIAGPILGSITLSSTARMPVERGFVNP